MPRLTTFFQRLREQISGASPSAKAPALRDVAEEMRRHLAQGNKQRALQLLRATPLPAETTSDVLFDWGVLHRDCGDPAGAEKVWLQAMQSSPIDPRIANNLAALNLKAQRLGDALRFAQQAVAVAPNFAPGQVNLGIIYAMQGDNNAAQSSFKRALEVDPDNLDAVRNMVMLYDEMGEREAASRMLHTYLRLAPHESDALYLASVYALRRGDLTDGWRGYAHRWSRLGQPRRLKGVPRWSGEPLAGKRILVSDEQGIGEQVSFVSCIPELIEQRASVVLMCAPKLQRLFANSFPAARVLASGVDDNKLANDAFDYQAHMGDLPAFFRQTLDQVVSVRPYLRAEPERASYWRARIADLGPGLKVGVSWRGGSSRTGGLLRSVALEQWRPILSVPGVQFVNLQYTDCAAEIADVQRRFGCTLHTWNDALGDYAETAALVSALDLVISVATALVRLSGGLGKDVWVLVPVSADWIYQNAGETTPWVPSARLFRQDHAMQWEQCIQRVTHELQVRAVLNAKAS